MIVSAKKPNRFDFVVRLLSLLVMFMVLVVEKMMRVLIRMVSGWLSC